MKKLFTLTLFLILCAASSNAATYLISNKATNAGESITHKGIGFTVGTTAFADFPTFLASNIESNSTVYVDNGTYSGNITIATDGLTFLGNNAFRDWTVTRATESIITSTIYINASNVTINGFKFTEGGRIESSSATNAAPLSGIKVLYNYFTGSTVKRSTSNPLVEIGNIIANADANSTTSQCRYKNCEASHNYFEGDATHYPNCIGFGGAFGTTTVVDNFFYDGGTSVYIANAQGTLNIKHNVFKNVGKTTYTAPDGGAKGDFCIALYRSAYANSTTANIIANEFDGCYGQTSLFPLIRVFQGNSGGTDQVTAKNFRVNVNENTFKNKTSTLPSASHAEAGEKLILYNDKGGGAGIIFNLSNNHYDNRFYKYTWVTLQDGQGIREVYADQFTRFDLGGKMSTFGTSVLTGTDVATHATGITLGSATILQSFDIDPLTGDMYFIQKMNGSRITSYNSQYGFSSDHDGLTVTRVPCTKINGHTYTYSTSIQSMEIGYGGHGTNLCFVRDKNGQGWLWSGGKATIKSTDDLSQATARWKFASGTDINLDGSGKTDSGVKYFDASGSGSNDYPACDETSRYLCVRTSGSGVNTYRIYDLDDALNDKQTLLKTVTLNKGEFANSSISGDAGYNTWDFQSFDINGDYIYVLEGCSDENSSTSVAGDPTLVITCYNWRSNEYCYRTRLNYARINNIYGEPEGMVLRFDQYGHANLFVAVPQGAAGSRKANVYKYIIDYHTGYDETNGTATTQGDDTKTTGNFGSDYPAITFSCNTNSLNFSASTLSENPSKTVKITNGEYMHGQWYGVITGEDGDAFTVSTASNTAFSTSATATVKFTPKANKSTYKAELRLFSPLASSKSESNDIVIPITATYSGANVPETPTIKINATNVSLSTEVGSEVSKEISIQGSALTGNIILTLSGTDADQFSLSTNSLSSNGGNATIYYNPSESGNHKAMLIASANGAEDVEITISGTANDAPVVVTGYNLSQDWAQTAGHLTANTNTRWATGFDGKIYINDHANSMLYYWNANGLTNTGIASAAGTAITSDDAGNIIVSTSMYAGGNTAMKVLPANETSFKDLTLTMPDGVTANQMQYLGKAIGNIMSAEGGAIFIFPKDATAVAKIIIKNGIQTSATKIDVTAITADAQAIAIPLTNDINSNVIAARVRGSKHFYYNNGTAFVPYADNGINTTQGGTLFTLNGTLFNVQPIGTTAYLDGFQIVDIANNNIVATHTAQFTTAAAAPNPNCITAEVVSPYEARLYQYVPGQLAAQYTFSLQTSGIDNEIANTAKVNVVDKNLIVEGVDVAKIDIYSISGIITTTQLNSNTINLASHKGVYIVVVTDQKGNRTTHKVVL